MYYWLQTSRKGDLKSPKMSMLEIRTTGHKTWWHVGHQMLTAACCYPAKTAEVWGKESPFLTATCQIVKNLRKNQRWSELFNWYKTG